MDFNGTYLVSCGWRPSGDQGSGLGRVGDESLGLQDSMMVELWLSACSILAEYAASAWSLYR